MSCWQSGIQFYVSRACNLKVNWSYPITMYDKTSICSYTGKQSNIDNSNSDQFIFKNTCSILKLEKRAPKIKN